VAVDNVYGTATSSEVHFSVVSNKPPIVSLGRSASVDDQIAGGHHDRCERQR
jgi:hypothetical protein